MFDETSPVFSYENTVGVTGDDNRLQKPSYHLTCFRTQVFFSDEFPEKTIKQHLITLSSRIITNCFQP